MATTIDTIHEIHNELGSTAIQVRLNVITARHKRLTDALPQDVQECTEHDRCPATCAIAQAHCVAAMEAAALAVEALVMVRRLGLDPGAVIAAQAFTALQRARIDNGSI